VLPLFFFFTMTAWQHPERCCVCFCCKVKKFQTQNDWLPLGEFNKNLDAKNY
jgi:hypothetical protein